MLLVLMLSPGSDRLPLVDVVPGPAFGLPYFRALLDRSHVLPLGLSIDDQSEQDISQIYFAQKSEANELDVTLSLIQGQ